MNGNIWHQLITLSWLHKPSKWYKNLFSSCTKSELWLVSVSLISKTDFKRFLGTQRQYQWNQSYLHTPVWPCDLMLGMHHMVASVRPNYLSQTLPSRIRLRTNSDIENEVIFSYKTFLEEVNGKLYINCFSLCNRPRTKSHIEQWL